MYRSLASVARFEFNALMQDTRQAVESLKRQQESVAQAIEVAQQAHAATDLFPDDTAAQLLRLENRLKHLYAALEQVIAEAEGVETFPGTAGVKPVLALPALYDPPAPQPSSALLSQIRRLRELSERFLQTCCRKVAPLVPSWVKGVELPCR